MRRRKPWKRVLYLVIFAALGYAVYYGWISLPIITGYDAKMLCSCVYVEGHDEKRVVKEDLPKIDFILLSHNHYDHLDKSAIQYLTSKNIPVITMLKVGDQLQKWGVDPLLITELDWWETIEPAEGFIIRALPARHFSGRWLNDRFKTLWGSFAIRGPKHHVYFGADSGYYDGFSFIGKELGPFDLSLLDTGAYNELWESIHMGPENAVQANIDLRSKILMPIHWGTFSLALHPWTEPVERVIRAAESSGVHLLVPAPGETVEVEEEYISNWWKETV